MLLEEGSICILNPKDEEPHHDMIDDKIIHFQHGDTKVTGNDISVAFVFRVSPHMCLCNSINNIVMLPEEILANITEKERNGKVNEEKRNILYNDLDIKGYHDMLKAHFQKYYKT